MPYVQYMDREVDRAIARFTSRLVPVESGCIEWGGGTNRDGYGIVSSIYFPTTLAHRVAWWIAGLEFDEDRVLDHICRNRRCCNVDHLEQVTFIENLRRGGLGDRNRQKTHCPKGHAYDERNTLFTNGRRKCRRCDNAARVARRRRAAA